LQDPPYWKLKGCVVDAFDQANTSTCFKDRTVYVIGISTARQYAFHLLEMLGGNSINRETQKKLCPKDGVVWDSSCTQTIQGVTLKFLFLHYMDGFNYTGRGGFPYYPHKSNDTLPSDPNELKETYGEEKFYPYDSCSGQSIRSCLSTFFANSTESDVLIFSLGYVYGMQSNIINMQSWLRSSAAGFRANLAATFNGIVFRVTPAQYNNVKELEMVQLLKNEETISEIWG